MELLHRCDLMLMRVRHTQVEFIHFPLAKLHVGTNVDI